MFDKKTNKFLTFNDIQHLSSYEISDILGNFKKEDFGIGKKYNSNFSSFDCYFTLTIV